MNAASIYDKPSIASGLSDAVDTVNQYVNGLNRERFEFAPPGKWNAGQQLDHLVRSIKPLNLAYALPVIALKLKFGIANRPSKTYDQLVEKYTKKLAEGGKAMGQFIPDAIPYDNKQKLQDKYAKQMESLVRKISRYKEEDLDKYILPHPLLGKLTLREMLFFTIYHNHHHLKLMKDYMEKF